MAAIRFLDRAAVERLLDLDRLRDALREAFVELSSGAASVPPRIAAVTPDGFLAAMPGFLPSAGLGVKLVSVTPANHHRGLPSHQALIAVFDPATGTPVALMDGTHITAVRTAASAAVAVDALARPDARVLAILGAGVQGAAHLDAVTRVRGFSEVRVASRNRAHAAALAGTRAGARAAASFEEAVRGADVVCCCTDASSPVLDPAWLAAGAHVSSVGTSRQGPELPAAVIDAADVLCVESRLAFSPFPAGAHELAGRDPSAAVELGEVLAGTRPGRNGDGQLTVYKSMGHAVEDLAAARLVLEAAERGSEGSSVTF